jgi:hypothetical protein
MKSMQKIEIEKYHDDIVEDVAALVEKYRKAMDWDIPENDEELADKLIFNAIQQALDKVKSNQ